jgi:serine/threonine protein kinase
MIRDRIYKIGKLLGQGAHGRVYQAIRQDDEEWFAIKMIRYIARDMDEFYSARLAFEAELVALNVFKNIPQVIHYDDFETSYVQPTDDQLGECNRSKMGNKLKGYKPMSWRNDVRHASIDLFGMETSGTTG